MNGEISLWGFLAGLGLFLFGMAMLEQGLRGLNSSTMKRVLFEQTRTPLRGLLTGVITTTILQSSSLVGLIILAFVGAGVLQLRNAMAVILGSNLGTTLKGWLVTLIGFKLDMAVLAHPALAIGAMMTVFLRQDSKPWYYGNLALGLGLILAGMGEMTSGFASLSAHIDPAIFHGRSMLTYFTGGILFTALIQSSSATMVIVLGAMHAGLLSLHEAAPIVIGADLGTTSTIMLAALKGTREKRRVALSHFFFNLVTNLLALLMYPLLLGMITSTLRITDPLFALVAFHSIFNVAGIALFMPWLRQFEKFLIWMVPDEDGVYAPGQHIRQVPTGIADAATQAARLELSGMILHAIKLNLHCFKLNPPDVFPRELQAGSEHHLYEDDYAALKRASGEMLGYTFAVQARSQDQDDIRELTRLNHAVRNTGYAAKFIKDIRHNLVEFRHADAEALQEYQQTLHIWVTDLYRRLLLLIANRNPELAEDHFETLKADLRNRYEGLQQTVYRASGENQLDDETTATLLNVIRAIYLSTSALLEAVAVLLHIEKDMTL